MSADAMFYPRTKTGQFLLWVWDMVDISENMGRVEDWTFTISNGLAALIHAAVFIVLTSAAAALTWYFDLESTIAGMSSLTNSVIPSLPGQVAHFAGYVVLAFTIMPTLLEIFTAGMAKQNVKIIQIAIIGFTLFDMVTDIPRAYQLAMGMWPQIQAMGWGLSQLTFWAYFLGWLFFATLGFELLMVVFGYATFVFITKTVKGEGSFNVAPRRGRNPAARSRSRGPATRVDHSANMPADEEVIIIEG